MIFGGATGIFGFGFGGCFSSSPQATGDAVVRVPDGPAIKVNMPGGCARLTVGRVVGD